MNKILTIINMNKEGFHESRIKTSMHNVIIQKKFDIKDTRILYIGSLQFIITPFQYNEIEYWMDNEEPSLIVRIIAYMQEGVDSDESI